MKKIILILSCPLFFSSFATAQQGQASQSHDFNAFVPTPIVSTGIPVCDAYFSQLEICMKKLIPSSQHQELEVGLNEGKQAVIYNAGQPEEVANKCQQAINAAKLEYASKGCVFN
ncbi:MAG: hypothetical protein ACRCWR_11755 [Saezia sp.]